TYEQFVNRRVSRKDAKETKGAKKTSCDLVYSLRRCVKLLKNARWDGSVLCGARSTRLRRERPRCRSRNRSGETTFLRCRLYPIARLASVQHMRDRDTTAATPQTCRSRSA